MRTCIVNLKTNLVENVIERGLMPVEPETLDGRRYVEHTSAPDGFLWIDSDTAQIGWLYVNGALSAPPALAPDPATVLKAALSAFDAQYPITQRNLRDLVVILGDSLKTLGVDLTTLKGYQVAKAIEAQAKPLRDQLAAIK